MFKDIIIVWTVTIIANVLSFFSGDFIQLLPIIRDLFAIVSILIAMGYTLYKFKKDWVGVWPKKNK